MLRVENNEILLVLWTETSIALEIFLQLYFFNPQTIIIDLKNKKVQISVNFL